MKKFTSILLIICALFALFSVTAFASDGTEAVNDGENIMEILYAFFTENADKILSALAFLGSLLIAFTYRRGFLPLIKGSLNKLSSETEKILVENKGKVERAELVLEKTNSSMDYAINEFKIATESLMTLEREILETGKSREKCERLTLIMEAQIDMLYEIFMSSSIPAYQKESVGEKISAMKKALMSAEGDNA